MTAAVNPKRTVRFRYVCRDRSGRVLEQSAEADGDQVVLGQGHLLPALENALLSLTPGAGTTVRLRPDQAFGPYREELVGCLDPADLDLDEPPTPGTIVTVNAPGAEEMQATVLAVDDGGVTIDGNHPLAGENLIFDLELIAWL